MERLQKFRSSLEPQPKELMEQYKSHLKRWEQKALPCSLRESWDVLTNVKSVKDIGWRYADDGLTSHDGETDVLLTIDKTRYDLGEENRKIAFASYGCQDFEQMLKQTTRTDLPPWCVRLETKKEGIRLVAYGVITSRGPVLVTGLSQLETIGSIKFNGEVSETDRQTLLKELDAFLEAELTGNRKIRETLAHGRAAENAQINLDLFVARAIIETYARLEGKSSAAAQSLKEVVKFLDSKGAYIDGENGGDQPYNLLKPTGMDFSYISGASNSIQRDDKLFSASPDAIDSAMSLIFRLLGKSKGQSVESAMVALARQRVRT